ncbi:MAG: ABC transporter permease subunit, partial [Acidobacteriota bacterium]
HHTSTRYRSLPSWPLRGWQAVAAFVTCALPVLFGFVIPFGLFASKTLRQGDARAAELFLTMGRNSFILGALASLLAVSLALLVAFGDRLHGAPLSRVLARIAGVGYAIPGGVIAIGILITVTWADRRIGGVAGSLFGSAPGLLLSGSVVAVLYGYQTRFLAVSLSFLQASLTRIRPTLDDAARTLGATTGRMLGTVHLPLLRGTVLAAALLVFVDVVKELPATLILRPFGFETLAVRVYQLAHDERLNEASSGALAIILIGLLPVAILSRMLDRSRPGFESAAASSATDPRVAR